MRVIASVSTRVSAMVIMSVTASVRVYECRRECQCEHECGGSTRTHASVSASASVNVSASMSVCVRGFMSV